jgi:O-antigen/teichoic acid export membrane protein
MGRVRRLLIGRYGVLLANVGARVAALVSLSLATVVVARHGGPKAVGVYALLRVLPSLVGVVMSAGLPGSVAYFRAGPYRDDRRLPTTLVTIMAAGAAAGAAVWLAATPLLSRVLFDDLSTGLVMLAACAVVTRVIVATAKSCSQGGDDLRGANRVIVTEELMFLPVYGLLLAVGARGFGGIVVGLILADCATASLAWGRLIRRGFFRHAARPSLELARKIAAYGTRAQIGGLVTLLNLRLDFILLNIIAGPAVLGVYAIASKFAELLKIPGMSLTYVLYPRYARDGRTTAAANARRAFAKAGALTAGAVVPMWFAASFVIPAIYGSEFRPAILPAQIILLGLALDGLGGVITGFLYGVGRPGLNSLAMGAGLTATVVLDLLLIPPFGATGAATASAGAYITSTLALVWFFWRLGRTPAAPAWQESVSKPDAVRVS